MERKVHPPAVTVETDFEGKHCGSVCYFCCYNGFDGYDCKLFNKPLITKNRERMLGCKRLPECISGERSSNTMAFKLTATKAVVDPDFNVLACAEDSHGRYNLPHTKLTIELSGGVVIDVIIGGGAGMANSYQSARVISRKLLIKILHRLIDKPFTIKA